MIPTLEQDFTTECEFVASRSGGAGGQNVNKVNTKVELRFAFAQSALLTDEQKQTISVRLASHINAEGILRVVSQKHRTQLQNKEECIKKFYDLLKKAFTIPKKRVKTRIPKAIKQERLDSKRHNAEKKAARRRLEE